MAVRVDKWLWAVRVYKSRSGANDACASGRVRVNGDVAKPATKLKVGDRVEIRRRDRTLILDVEQLLEKRVSAALAADAYGDQSPPPPVRPGKAGPEDVLIEQARRERGAGRPTKRDRRQMEKMKRDIRGG